MTAFSSKPAQRVRYSNRSKVLLCYLCCFAVPPLWLLSGLRLVYPYRLVGSAPLIFQNLRSAFPFLSPALDPQIAVSADPAGRDAQAWAEALRCRDQQWMLYLLAVFAVIWVITLVLQLCWRGSCAQSVDAARNVFRAIRRYRTVMAVIWLVNLAGAALIWLPGARWIPGRTYWDVLVYFVPYGLNALAAFLCCRLAAPPAVSGKRAFFKRL